MDIDTPFKRRFLSGTENNEDEDERLAPHYRTQQSTERDCYNMYSSGTSAYSSNDNTVNPSSWLCDNNVYYSGSTEGTTACVDTQSFRQEVETVAAQLLQVKRRLGPAAEQCAQASSSTAHYEFANARSACNPFECLADGLQHSGGSRMFINRSAVKLANIDALLDFTLVQGRGWFKFVDLCGAPGGFSEYIMRRCQNFGIQYCQGVGMSLNGTNEHGQGLAWKLNEGRYGNNGSYKYKICHGNDGTGDVCNWNNIQALQLMLSGQNAAFANIRYNGNSSFVLREQDKAQLATADGGIDAQRDCEFQEQLTQKLVVCQAVAAVSILKQGGTFVIKMFGFQTPTIRYLMYKLSLMFSSFIVLKPVSSRPASAERYVVFRGFNYLESSWDALQWRDEIFLGPVPTQSVQMDSEENSKRLLLYLDTIDRDLLALNLKACFTILSYLENRYRSLTSTMNNGTSIPHTNPTYNIDIEQYKIDWKLFHL